MSSSISGSSGRVSLNLLAKDLDRGLDLLREILTAPRFPADKLALTKEQILQQMRQRNDESASIENRELASLAYGEQFWANQDYVSNSLVAITRDDLVQFQRRWICPSNFIIPVSGDFERADMIAKLNKLLGNWPFQGQQPPAIPTNTMPAMPGIYLVNKDVNQGRVSLLLPGLMRNDPDYYAAVVMNDILGGGGLASRMFNRIRTEEGLAYQATSSLPGSTY